MLFAKNIIECNTENNDKDNAAGAGRPVMMLSDNDDDETFTRRCITSTATAMFSVW